MTIGFDQPLYILPFDHRGSFQTKMFGWKGTLTEQQTADIAATKQVIYDAFKAAVAGGVPKPKAGILVYEAPNADQGAVALYTRIVSDNKAAVVSNSWGGVEADSVMLNCPLARLTAMLGQRRPSRASRRGMN